jgi:hypothetical protein
MSEEEKNLTKEQSPIGGEIKSMSVGIETISEEHLDFYSKHAKTDSYNPLENKLNLTQAYCVVIRKEGILAIMVSIPHTIFINPLGLMKTVISTYLLVHTDYRTSKVGQAIVMAAIKEGYVRKINMGYHWITNSTKSPSSIDTKNWYRPLVVKKAKISEYGFIKGADYSLSPLKGYSIKKSVVENFVKISSNKVIKLAPTEEELELLSNVITFLTVYKDNIPVGIVGYRPFPIIKPHLKIHPVQLCYFDSTTDLEVDVLSTLFNKLKDDGIIAIHGVVMSGIDKTISKLFLSICGDITLDFYGLNHTAKDCTRISMLYF